MAIVFNVFQNIHSIAEFSHSARINGSAGFELVKPIVRHINLTLNNECSPHSTLNVNRLPNGLSQLIQIPQKITTTTSPAFGQMKTTAIMMSTLVLLCALLVGPTLATEVLINSGRNGESTSQSVSVVTAAAVPVQTVKVTTTSATTTKEESQATVKRQVVEGGEDTLDLDKAETKDPTKKLDIIKQIRKINKDGSYTVGYEAGDGTFKIESRDVLGNVKGTYGYVDSTGEIKRVSYNGNNGTSALKSFPNEVANDDSHADDDANNNKKDEEQEELSTTLPNVNHQPEGGRGAAAVRTSLRSMRRPPALKFLSTTPASFGPKSNYIQTIPKRRLAVPSSTERSQYSHYATAKTAERPTNHPSSTRAPTTVNAAEEQQTPTTIVYARTVPTQKPLIILRPTTQATSTSQTQEQISRPEKLEINHVSKVMVMKSTDTSTSKSINADKENDRKSIRGNNLRRQLAQEREDHYEAQPQHLYAQNAGEDSQHIFDGATGNLRPLYSTANRPSRVPSIVLAARQRAAQLQNALNTNSAPTTTTEKVYVRPPPAAVQYESTTSEPRDQDSNYLTQSPSGTVVQIPANQGIAQQATEDQGSIYGQRPAPFSLRQHQQQQQQQAQGPYQGTEPPNSLFRFPPPPSARGDQFLRETTPSSSAAKHREDSDEPVYGRQTHQRPRGGPYDSESGYQQGSYPVPFQQNPYGYYPGQGAALSFPQRPVTTRDFENILQLLVNRHQTPRFGAGGYGGGIGGGFGGYSGFNPGLGPYLSSPYQGVQQYPRSQLYDPVGFDPRYGYNNNFGGFRQYSEQQNSVYPSQGQQGAAADPIQQQQQPQVAPSQFAYDGQQGFNRQRQFTGSNYNYYGANSAPAINPYQPQQQTQPLRGGFAQQQPQQPYYQPDFSNVQQSYATQASTQQDYLPSEVREDLLYRMLMLAIQGPGGAGGGESQQPPQIGAFSDPVKSVHNTGNSATEPEESSPATENRRNYQHNQQINPLHHSHRSNSVQTATRKPVRSVQILGEAEE